MNVYLDDMRKEPKNFILAKTYKECISLLESNNIDILSLDHDLGDFENGKEYTGYDVAMYIVEKQENESINIWPKEIYMHTANPIGRQNMFSLLNNYKPSNVKVYNYPYMEK
jgi:hypothetical protein